MGLSAKDYDAKKAALEAQIKAWEDRSAGWDKMIAQGKAELAALGPRPAERVVTWTDADGRFWRWTFEGRQFYTEMNWRKYTRRDIEDDVPHDVALRVLLLAYPEGPVTDAEIRNALKAGTAAYHDDQGIDLGMYAHMIAALRPLFDRAYRAPVGIAAGACVVKDGKAHYVVTKHENCTQAEAQKAASQYAGINGGTVCDLSAVPRKEAT